LGAALCDDALEEAAGGGRAGEQAHRGTARRLAEDRHPVRIAAKASDVGPDPAEGRDHIAQAVVAGRPTALAIEIRMRQEPENTEPIGDAHQHYALLRRSEEHTSELQSLAY